MQKGIVQSRNALKNLDHPISESQCQQTTRLESQSEKREIECGHAVIMIGGEFSGQPATQIH